MNPSNNQSRLSACEGATSTEPAATTPQPKWVAVIDDTVIAAPQRQVRADVLKTQGKVCPGNVLVRDRNSDRDEIIPDEVVVDLGEGNVFYALPRCEADWKSSRESPAKLAYVIDDRPETTTNADQTGKTLREWFSLPLTTGLFRDYESPEDRAVGLADPAAFTAGPVFYTRHRHSHLKIIVNKKTFTEADGVKEIMTGREIAALVAENPDRTEVFRLGKEPPEKILLDQQVSTKGCPEFRVIRLDVKGGFEPARIERELAQMRENGLAAEFHPGPPAVVIYRRIPARPGYPHLQETDVLVQVPSGYPGQPLDGAWLPDKSPLLGRVVGSPQGSPKEIAGLRWHLVSYHPHNGGGAPPWNKDRHGFHTYVDEIMVWVYRAKE
ncbi:MAG: hypothetical protein IT578_12050 [Verrucomicrobiae bacterium]|nr:hypothetical protein [Verrucomicrobiae bacterium]